MRSHLAHHDTITTRVITSPGGDISTQGTVSYIGHRGPMSYYNITYTDSSETVSLTELKRLLRQVALRPASPSPELNIPRPATSHNSTTPRRGTRTRVPNTHLSNMTSRSMHMPPHSHIVLSAPSLAANKDNINDMANRRDSWSLLRNKHT
jgi:hypothetical protein